MNRVPAGGGGEQSSPSPRRKVVKRNRHTSTVFGWTPISVSTDQLVPGFKKQQAIRLLYSFENGFSVSVIRSIASLGGARGKWEALVFYSETGDNVNPGLLDPGYFHTNPVGWLGEMDVFGILHYVAGLEKLGNLATPPFSQPGRT